jgi:hypothetical protein
MRHKFFPHSFILFQFNHQHAVLKYVEICHVIKEEKHLLAARVGKESQERHSPLPDFVTHIHVEQPLVWRMKAMNICVVKAVCFFY